MYAMKPSDTLRPSLSRSRIILGWFLLASLTMTGHVPTARSQSVSTYHYDNLRTGWNSNETTLTPQNVASTNFHLLTTVPLDEQVDAQPLLVTGVSIAGGTHDVLYVATENNTLYALDAATGSILLTRDKTTLGSPDSERACCWPPMATFTPHLQASVT
jgi:outer membrane protein assembly factor BamB